MINRRKKRFNVLTVTADIILVDSIRPLKLISIILMACTMLGLYIQHFTLIPDSDLVYLYQLAPWWVWVCLFGYTLCMRSYGLFSRAWKPERSKLPSTSIIGIFLWSTVFMSGAVIGKFDGLELLYIMPALLETWILARQIGVPDYGN